MSTTRKNPLHSISLFEELTEPELDKVAALARVRSYPARTAVVSQGEPARELFVIVRGRLKVVASGSEGRDTVLGIMAEREVFGEVALLDGGVRSATVTTVGPCELLVIEREQFFDLLRDSPSISVKLMVVLAKRLRRLSQRSEDVAFLDVPSRIARCLLDLAHRFGEQRAGSNELRITLKLSQQELGELVGATRESVNKHLADWARQNLVSLDEGRVVILDVENLRKKAGISDD